MEGAKLVLFVTGLCGKRCFYCTLSEKRKDKDRTWANERPVRKSEDIIEEAERMRARGAGITGGDPVIRSEKTLEYAELLKNSFGEDFHIHMYTSSALSKEKLQDLKDAGLDELRFHITAGNNGIWNTIKVATAMDIETGVEIPCIPNEYEKILQIAKRLNDIGGNFLNLNELEFSEINVKELRKRGFELKSEVSYAVKGSEETALKILTSCRNLDLNIHYCSSSYKDSVQLRKRLLRTAKNTAKAYEEVSKDGLFLKGVIILDKPMIEKLVLVRNDLIKLFKIPQRLIAVDKEKMRIETSVEIAERLSKIYRQKGLRYLLVEEYPTSDRLETEVIPLSQ
jgi:hypothetical protein